MDLNNAFNIDIPFDLTCNRLNNLLICLPAIPAPLSGRTPYNNCGDLRGCNVNKCYHASNKSCYNCYHSYYDKYNHKCQDCYK